eukprot:gene7749-12219_t
MSYNIEEWIRGEGRGSQLKFASADAGSKILESSSTMKKTSKILIEDKNSYLYWDPTNNLSENYFIVELSEEISMHSFQIRNDEYFSSSIKLFEVYGSTKYPTKSWDLFDKFHADDKRRLIQTFSLKKPEITRYLKFVFLSYHLDEFYCTLSLLRVYGLTLIEDLKQEEKIDDDDDDDDNSSTIINQNLNSTQSNDNSIQTKPSSTLIISSTSKSTLSNQHSKISPTFFNSNFSSFSRNEFNFEEKNCNVRLKSKENICKFKNEPMNLIDILKSKKLKMKNKKPLNVLKFLLQKIKNQEMKHQIFVENIKKIEKRISIFKNQLNRNEQKYNQIISKFSSLDTSYLKKLKNLKQHHS